MDVVETLRRDSRFQKLVGMLRSGTPLVAADGLWGSCAPILAALAADATRRPLLLITPHADEADDFRDDIETVLGRAPDLLPQLESLPHEIQPDDELAAERLRLCLALLAEPGGASARQTAAPADARLIVTSIHALMQPVPSAESLAQRCRELRVGAALEPAALTDWLGGHGFQRCDQVEVPGDFAQRGGIIDVFCHAHTDPVRLEFLGDQIDSIRLFDAGTQRSTVSLEQVRIPALAEPESADPAAAAARTTSFLALLPASTIIAVSEPREAQELGRAFWQRLGEPRGFITVEAIYRTANQFAQLHLQRFAGAADQAVEFGVTALPPFGQKAPEALLALRDLATECQVEVVCDNPAEEQRLGELLAESDAAPRPAGPDGTPQAPMIRLAERVRRRVGVIHRGFRWGGYALVPHHELFGRYRQKRTLRRVQPARPLDSFFDLNGGDHVVHTLHGIGKFLGLKSIEREGRQEEYLALEFADHAVVHVPTSQIHVVQKYIGSFRGKPTLSKVGGTAWKRTKERVAEAVIDMAAELLAVQARRATEPGIAYPQDTLWQREFEGAFLYTETADQLRAIVEIKGDMAAPRPMDRLLCGDVGYGKTELAMRSAFKAVEYGRQVAVLVPTTVLAEQHFQTFRERFADYPFTIESLSRFRAPAEQKRIIAAVRKGQVDVLIGTHRLLSADVHFADLGLVVIDEEQRFGVEAKEKLKRLRATVDVLTLSATPIPRTLHMSMLGIRDISSLATPPVDRRAIVTQVRLWEGALIREAIVRELNRDGQVYFVHNFVRDIHEIANQIRVLVPEARVVVGHGQMDGAELEEVMLKFLHREADVLVSTNIIESGLDIPSANTIFINRAERFGLADLHQLRGRVGRSKHRAYAYLLLSPKHPVQENAARRLKAIEQYSELGAGFQIAMRDLEIRGAGNILGPEQSGHIEAVGYEMYCQLLEQAVRRLKNEPAETWRPVNLELGQTASIPRTYLRAERQRMDVYKRLTSCRTLEEIRTLHDDLRDAFGPVPEPVQTLLSLAEIRVLAQRWGIRSVVLDPPDVVFAVDDLQRVQELFASGPGSPRVPDAHTVHWRLPKALLEPARLVSILQRQLSGAAARELNVANRE